MSAAELSAAVHLFSVRGGRIRGVRGWVVDKELDIAGYMSPADEVGGDYYDVLSSNGVVKIGIGDVTGHGLESGVSVSYERIAAEAMAQRCPGQFDVVTCMEMLEHVPDPAAIVRAAADLVKPGGHVFFSTLNRNPKSYLFAVIGAEYILRMLPRGTHDYGKFLTPAELSQFMRAAGLLMPLDDFRRQIDERAKPSFDDLGGCEAEIFPPQVGVDLDAAGRAAAGHRQHDAAERGPERVEFVGHDVGAGANARALLDHRAQQRQLADLESRGARRRSGRG